MSKMFLVFSLVISSMFFGGSAEIITCKDSKVFDCYLNNLTITNDTEILLDSAESVKSIGFAFVAFKTNFIGNLIKNFTDLQQMIIDNSTGVNHWTKTSLGIQLTVLKIRNSGLKAVDGEIFPAVNRLEKVFLSANGIKTVHENAFKHLKNVILIDLRSNEISWLNEGTFSACFKLEVLNLTSNLLTIIPFKLLSRNLKLKKLAIANNEISAIEDGARLFMQMEDLSSIDLSGNPCTNLKVRGKFLVKHDFFSDLQECWKHFVLLQKRNQTMKIFLSENLKEIDENASEDKEIEEINKAIKNVMEKIKEIEADSTGVRQKWTAKSEENLRKKSVNMKNLSNFKGETKSHENIEKYDVENSNNQTKYSNENICDCQLIDFLLVILVSFSIPLSTFLLFEPRDFVKKLRKIPKHEENGKFDVVMKIGKSVEGQVKGRDGAGR